MRNLKYIPTKKLKEIIDHPYHQGIDGADYATVIDEIINIYNERTNREMVDEIERLINEREEY